MLRRMAFLDTLVLVGPDNRADTYLGNNDVLLDMIGWDLASNSEGGEGFLLGRFRGGDKV